MGKETGTKDPLKWWTNMMDEPTGISDERTQLIGNDGWTHLEMGKEIDSKWK